MKKRNFNLFVIMLLLSFACKDTSSTKHNDILIAENPTTMQLKNSTRIYLSGWCENDTSLLQSVTLKNIERNVNGKNNSHNQKELFEIMSFWHRAMPDIKLIEKEISVIGTKTYVTWLGTGSNMGMLDNTPPTGKSGHIEGMSVLTFNDAGYIINETTFFDVLGLMEEWGYTLVPPNMK